MSKEGIHGYIAYLSPKRPCRNLQPQFDIRVQDGRNTAVDVRGFGQDAYETIRPFHDSKSPVKVEVVRNTSYAKPVFNERCRVSEAKRCDVPYQFYVHSLKLKGVDGKTSIPTTVHKLLNSADVEDSTYYTLAGKVIIGRGAIKVRDNGMRVKADNYLFDETGNIMLTMWRDMWEAVSSGSTVEINYLKTRTYNNKKHVTTSPYTGIKLLSANENVVVPADFTAEEDTARVIFVNEIESVGVVNAFSKCTACDRKVKESDVREKSFTCTTCHMNYRFKYLVSDFVISVTVVSGDSTIVLNIPKSVATTLAEDVTADNVADVIFSLRNIDITYSLESNFVTRIIVRDGVEDE